VGLARHEHILYVGPADYILKGGIHCANLYSSFIMLAVAHSSDVFVEWDLIVKLVAIGSNYVYYIRP
jgi:hypothetical protein